MNKSSEDNSTTTVSSLIEEKENDENKVQGLVALPSVPVAKKVQLKRGRRPKKAIEAITKRKVAGPVPGLKAKVNEFTARLLLADGDSVVKTIIRKALNDDDKDQVACLKMCIDRMLPLSYFEEVNKTGSNAVTINIVGVAGSKQINDDTLDMEMDNG